MDVEFSVGHAIRQIRESKGITAKFVADKIGISNSTLCKYEKNRLKVRADMLPAIAEALGISVDVLLKAAS